MNEQSKYALFFVIIGVISLIIGLKWKKPSYGGGMVHKYTMIIIGLLFIIYGVLTLY